MKLHPGRVAVVTGGARGIGLAMAESLAARGLHTIVADNSAERLAALPAASGSAGTLEGFEVDVTEAGDVGRLADAAFARGSVQLVCSNAGIHISGRTWEVPYADWRRLIDVNIFGTVNMLGAFLPRLIAAGTPAHVLITGSMASVTARPRTGPYTTSKHALLGLAETTAHELTEAGAPIGVTLLMPSRVATPMSHATADEPGVLTTAAAADIALAAVEADQLFAFTHPEAVPDVDERFDAIVAGRTPSIPAPFAPAAPR